MNNELNTVKHLIKVQPVTFPQGLPASTDDLTKCRLMPDGRFLRTSGQAVRGEIVAHPGSGVSDTPSESNISNSEAPEKVCFRFRWCSHPTNSLI